LIWTDFQINQSKISSQLLVAESNKLFEKPYNPKNYTDSLKELQTLKLRISMDDETLHIYQLLHQWRDRLARKVDTEPKILMSTKALVNIACQKPDTTSQLERILLPFGVVHQCVKKTAHTVIKIIEEKDEFVNRMDNSLCQNCMNRGHIWGHCPFEKNPNRLKEYKKINPEYAVTQNRRRRENRKKKKLATQTTMSHTMDSL